MVPNLLHFFAGRREEPVEVAWDSMLRNLKHLPRHAPPPSLVQRLTSRLASWPSAALPDVDSHQPQSPFFAKLSPEIRLMIYEAILDGEPVRIMNHHSYCASDNLELGIEWKGHDIDSRTINGDRWHGDPGGFSYSASADVRRMRAHRVPTDTHRRPAWHLDLGGEDRWWHVCAHWADDGRKGIVATLFTCRKMYDETFPTFFDTNHFFFVDPYSFVTLARTMPSESFEGIRTMEIRLPERLNPACADFDGWNDWETTFVFLLRRLKKLQQLRVEVVNAVRQRRSNCNCRTHAGAAHLLPRLATLSIARIDVYLEHSLVENKLLAWVAEQQPLPFRLFSFRCAGEDHFHPDPDRRVGVPPDPSKSPVELDAAMIMRMLGVEDDALRLVNWYNEALPLFLQQNAHYFTSPPSVPTFLSTLAPPSLASLASLDLPLELHVTLSAPHKWQCKTRRWTIDPQVPLHAKYRLYSWDSAILPALQQLRLKKLRIEVYYSSEIWPHISPDAEAWALRQLAAAPPVRDYRVTLGWCLGFGIVGAAFSSEWPFTAEYICEAESTRRTGSTMAAVIQAPGTWSRAPTRGEINREYAAG